MITFLYPFAFLLLILPFIFRIFSNKTVDLHGDAIKVPNSFLEDIKNINNKVDNKKNILKESTQISLKQIFLFVVYSLIITSIARPQILGEPVQIRKHSREIMLVMDISTSMLETDFTYKQYSIDRLRAVKMVAQEFVSKRQNDKIGLIIFGTNAYLQIPITFDINSVSKGIELMEAGMAGNSTAIGDALGLALKTMIKSGDINKKVIILLTDGENNDGATTMSEAIKLADEEGIRTYTIGVGKQSSLMQDIFGFSVPMQHEYDEKSLRELAERTKGAYFKAEDTKALQEVYEEIDKLEPSVNEDIYIQNTVELYYIFLSLAVALSSIYIIWIRRKK